MNDQQSTAEHQNGKIKIKSTYPPKFVGLALQTIFDVDPRAQLTYL